MIEKAQHHAVLTTSSKTCAVTKIEHQVADEDLAAERLDTRMTAICTVVLLPQSDGLPSGRPCRDCARVLKNPRPPETPIAIPLDVRDLYAREHLVPLQRDRAGYRRPNGLIRLIHRGNPDTVRPSTTNPDSGTRPDIGERGHMTALETSQTPDSPVWELVES